MIRRAFVISTLLAAFACSVGEATKPDIAPMETTGLEAAGKEGPVPLGGLQFSASPAQPGSYATLSFATDGTFTGTLVVSCADGPCAHPNVAQVQGTWDEDGKSLNGHLEINQVALASGTPACKKLQNVVTGRKDDETFKQVPGTYLSVAGKNLCTGADFSLFQGGASTVGASGGSVSSPSGGGVTLPPGAVPGTTTITIAPSPGAPPPPAAAPVGTPYVLGPEGTTFVTPVTVTLPVDPTLLPPGTSAASAVIYTAPVGSTSYTVLPTTVVDATHVAAKTSHFSLFVVAIPLAPDGGVDCNVLIANVAAQPLVPPYLVAGLDFSVGDGGTPGTMTQLNSEAPGCFSYPERDFLADGGTVAQLVATDPNFNPGYRNAMLGDAVQMYYNMEAPPKDYLGIWQVGSGYTGAVNFQSRPGGRYGSWNYVLSVPTGVQRCPTEGGACATWAPPPPPGDGTQDAFDAWMDEIYDGMMWTFMSAADLGVRCQDTKIPLPLQGGLVAQPCRSVLNDGNGTASLGIRPLGFYFEIADSPADNTGLPTPNIVGFYGFISGGTPGCSTPDAALEVMDYTSSYLLGGIGAVSFNSYISNPFGDTESEIAQQLCVDQVDAAAPDPGYQAYSWGPQHEITVEFNTTGDQVNDAGVSNLNVAYKVIASQGYQGTSDPLVSYVPYGTGTDTFVLGVGLLTKNGIDYPIDWTNMSAARGIIAELVNAIDYGGSNPNANCLDVRLGYMGGRDCIITTDSSGTTTVTFPPPPWVPPYPFAMTFAPGATHPTTLVTVNPGGQ